MPQGVRTGKRALRGAKRSKAIALLARGDSLTSIGNLLGVARSTVRALAQSECVEVDQRKQRLANTFEQIALEGSDQMLHDVRCRRIKGASLVPVVGVSVDKLLALRGDTSLTINHRHTHEIKASHNALASALMSFHQPPKTITATVVENETNTRSDTENAGAKKGKTVAATRPGK